MATIRTVLASSSPSRRQVLRNAGIEPTIISPNFDEDALLRQLNTTAGTSPEEKVRALALGKARSVLAENDLSDQPTIVIACDSMLLLDATLSGKPHTEDEAIRRWKQQRGRTAELVTGHVILGVGDLESVRQNSAGGRLHETADAATAAETISTKVHFGHPSDADIAAYARSGEPLGCAGAFTLEAKGGWFIDAIEGDPSSVLGISLPLITRVLRGWNINISDLWE